MVSTAEGTMRERKELEGMLHDAAARVPGAGRGRTGGRGRDRRPAGRLCVTRGYNPERPSAALRAVRIEHGPPDAPGGESPRHVPGLGGRPARPGDDGTGAGRGLEMERAGTR